MILLVFKFSKRDLLSVKQVMGTFERRNISCMVDANKYDISALSPNDIVSEVNGLLVTLDSF